MYLKRIYLFIFLLAITFCVIAGGIYYFYTSQKRQLEINFKSEVTNIQVKELDTSLYLKYLSEWKLYDKPIAFLNHRFTLNEIREIQIILTSTVQREDIFYNDEKKSRILQATGQNYSDGIIYIYVYLDPELILKNKSNSELSSRIVYASLLRLYTLAFPSNIDVNVFTQQVREVRKKQQFDTIIHVTKI